MTETRQGSSQLLSLSLFQNMHAFHYRGSDSINVRLIQIFGHDRELD
jgi:hypothetical protein